MTVRPGGPTSPEGPLPLIPAGALRLSRRGDAPHRVPGLPRCVHERDAPGGTGPRRAGGATGAVVVRLVLRGDRSGAAARPGGQGRRGVGGRVHGPQRAGRRVLRRRGRACARGPAGGGGDPGRSPAGARRGGAGVRPDGARRARGPRVRPAGLVAVALHPDAVVRVAADDADRRPVARPDPRRRGAGGRAGRAQGHPGAAAGLHRQPVRRRHPALTGNLCPRITVPSADPAVAVATAPRVESSP